MHEITNQQVQEKFAAYSEKDRNILLQLRELIYTTAHELDATIVVTESLKWGQPSYAAMGGTPIRIDIFNDGRVAVFFHCQTNLVSYFRSVFGDTLTFSGNRAVVLDVDAPLPIADIKFCIESALLYHKKKTV